VVAGAESEGRDAAQTFVLIANTENRLGEATITLLPDVLSPLPVPAPLVLALPPNSRTTVPVTTVQTNTALPGHSGFLVQSSGASPVQIVVESAVYQSGAGTLWSAGSNALATPMP
jgi:hypothetical protein